MVLAYIFCLFCLLLIIAIAFLARSKEILSLSPLRARMRNIYRNHGTRKDILTQFWKIDYLIAQKLYSINNTLFIYVMIVCNKIRVYGLVTYSTDFRVYGKEILH